MDLMLLRHRIIMAAGGLVKRVASAVSGVVNFVTNVVHTTKVTCEFSPVQSGTGDPSPSNVRSISGWTGCVIHQNGKNLCQLDNDHMISFYGSQSIADGMLSMGVNTQKVVIIVPVKPSTTYTFGVRRDTSGTNTVFSINDYSDVPSSSISDNIISTLFTATYGSDSRTRTGTVTTSEGAKYIGFAFEKPSGAAAAKFNNFRLNLGSDTEYEAYQGSTKTITFTDQGDPLTVYGGTVTLNEDGSADLVEDWYYFSFDGVINKAGTIYHADNESKTYINFYSYLNGLSKNIVGTRWVQSTILCDKASESSSDDPDVYYKPSYNYVYLYIRKNVLSELTAAGVNAYLQSNPVSFSAKAEADYFTPNTYHFSNIGALQSFIGQNAIWHDMNGSITVEYYKNT